MRRLSRMSLVSLRVAKVLVGLTLVAATLWTTVPSAASDNEPTCHLACCAGIAKHKAGSCMSGSCHAFGGASHQASPRSEPDELLCGIKHLTKVASWRALNHASNFSKDSFTSPKQGEQLGSFTTSAVTKPCRPDCGNAGFANSNAQANHTSCAGARNQPAAPSLAIYTEYLQPGKATNSSRRKGAPRGPPTSS